MQSHSVAIRRRPVIRFPSGPKNAGLLFGATIVLFVVLMAIFAPFIAPHDPYAQDLSLRLLPPVWEQQGTWASILGTDQLGRDYLSRLIYGSRISLLIGLTAMGVSAIIGITLGCLAGYFGGWVDNIISYVITVRLAIPAVLVALAVVGLVGNSLQAVILVLGFLIWDRFAVVTRTVVMQEASKEYVAAAKCLGCTTKQVLRNEILPNIAPHLIVVATLEIANAVLLEAALSFLGLGVQPPIPSWGLMMSEGRDQMFFTPWLILFPGLALFVLILGFNTIGDRLQYIIGKYAE